MNKITTFQAQSLEQSGQREHEHERTHTHTSTNSTGFACPPWEQTTCAARGLWEIPCQGTSPAAALGWCLQKVKSPRFRTASLPGWPRRQSFNLDQAWSSPGRIRTPSAPGEPLERSQPAGSTSPYLGELGYLLAHFHVHLGVAVHSPAGAPVGISFGARASPGRMNVAVDRRRHR